MKTTVLVFASALCLSHLPTARSDDATRGPGEIRGKLQFKSRKVDFDGTNVGEVGNDRMYIAGHPDSPQRAIWTFEKLPKSVTTAPGNVVQAKLTCAHFYLSKGVGPGVQVVIRVVSHTCPQAPPDLQQKGEWQWVNKDAKGKTLKEQYEADVATYRAKKIDPNKGDADGWKAANALADEYGYYEIRLLSVLDRAETTIDLPAGLFRNALKNAPELGADGKPKRPLVSVYVKCETKDMLLGMMETDLHLVEKPAAKK